MTNVKALRRRLALLNKEAARISRKLQIIDTIGWRAVRYGDEYSYGGYVNYLTKDHGREAKSKAEQRIVNYSENGGHVERIMRGHEKIGRVH